MSESDPSGVRCIDAHQFSPNIAVGHENGTITIYDYSVKQVLMTKKVEGERVKSIQYINNGL